MRQVVKNVWPDFCASYEMSGGVVVWLYLDTLGYPTTGFGNRVFDTRQMATMPWKNIDGKDVSSADKIKEYNRVSALTKLKNQSGYAYRKSAQLVLTPEYVKQLMLNTTANYWAKLLTYLPNADDMPADAQMALMDMAWNYGPDFLPKWPNFYAAAKVNYYVGMAAHCIGIARSPREYRHRALFLTAAKVVAVKADSNVFWDIKTPTPMPKKDVPGMWHVSSKGGLWSRTKPTTTGNAAEHRPYNFNLYVIRKVKGTNGQVFLETQYHNFYKEKYCSPGKAPESK